MTSDTHSQTETLSQALPGTDMKFLGTVNYLDTTRAQSEPWTGTELLKELSSSGEEQVPPSVHRWPNGHQYCNSLAIN